MNRADASFRLLLIDNTGHMDRIVNGTPLLSFFRINKPPVGNVLIAYCDEFGNAKCEDYNPQIIQNLVISPYGDYKSICRAGFTELAKRRYFAYEELSKKPNYFLFNDGRGLQPVTQDSCTIIFCSDFFSFSPSYLRLSRIGVFGREYFIRPIDSVICLIVDEGQGFPQQLADSLPPWAQVVPMNSIIPYQLDFNQASIPKVPIFKKERFFNLVLSFPSREEVSVQFQMSSDLNSWPLPSDTFIKDIKNHPTPVPTYCLRKANRETMTYKPDPNYYKLAILSKPPEITDECFTVHIDSEDPYPFAVLNIQDGEWNFVVLPYNFPYFSQQRTSTEFGEYLKSVPLCYFAITKQYLLKQRYTITAIESKHNYSPFLKEKREFITAPGKHQHSSGPKLEKPSLDVIKLAMKNSNESAFESIEQYECIENFDTADNVDWNSFNIAVFPKSCLNNMWKCDSPVSIDRIRELMPHAQVQRSEVFSEESSEIPEETKQVQEKVCTVSFDGDIFYHLEQIVLNVRERDFEAVKNRLCAIQKENMNDFIFAKSFTVKTIDRFGLRGLVDKVLFDFLE